MQIKIIIVDWISNILVHVLPAGRPKKLALKVTRFHTTAIVLNTLYSQDIILAMILS